MIFQQFLTSFWPLRSDLLGPLGGLMLPTKLLFGRSKRGSKTIWKSTYMKKWTKPPWTRFIPVLGPSRGHKSVVKQKEFEDFHFGYWRRLEDHFGAILVPSCLPRGGQEGLFLAPPTCSRAKKTVSKRFKKEDENKHEKTLKKKTWLTKEREARSSGKSKTRADTWEKLDRRKDIRKNE